MYILILDVFSSLQDGVDLNAGIYDGFNTSRVHQSTDYTTYHAYNSKNNNNEPQSNKMVLLNVRKETAEGQAFCQHTLYQRQNNTWAC